MLVTIPAIVSIETYLRAPRETVSPPVVRRNDASVMSGYGNDTTDGERKDRRESIEYRDRQRVVSEGLGEQ